MANHKHSDDFHCSMITPSSRKRTKSESSLTPSPANQQCYKSLRMFSPGEKQNSVSHSDLPKDWSNLSQHEKLDRLMEKLMIIDDIKEKVDTIIKDKDEQVGSDLLLLKISSLEGKNRRLEREVDHLNSKLEDLQWRDMRDNLVFSNIQESQGEDCELLIVNFLKEEMNIAPALIYSQQNVSGEIRIDVAHRIGKRNANSFKPRALVVKFVTRKGKEFVLKHASNLKGKHFTVSNQMPAEMRERRSAQTDAMKNLRKEHPDRASHKIHLMKDKLLHNGKVVEPPFERNKLPDLNVLPIRYDEMLHSQPIMQQGSVFQGHAISIHSIKDAVQARDALF